MMAKQPMVMMAQVSRAEYEQRAEYGFTIATAITLALLGLVCLGLWQMQPPHWGSYVALIGAAAFGIVLTQWVRLTTTQLALTRQHERSRVRGGDQ